MIKRSKYWPLLNLLLPLLIWMVVIMVPYIVNMGNFTMQMETTAIRGLFLNNILLIVIFYVHTYLVYPLASKRYGIYKYTLLLAVCLAAYSLTRHHYREPMPKFINPDFPPPNPGFMVLPFVAVIVLSIAYRLYMDKTIREKQIKERETLHLKTELELLSAQISPHFMFNLLNTMVYMSRKKPELVEPSLISLSQLMRYMLYDSEEGKISLSEEIDYLKNYMNLQLLRFGDDISVNLYLSGQLDQHKIEPMLIIPFVENAFKHGIGALEHPHIDVSLDINGNPALLKLEVINGINQTEIAALPTTKKKSGIGLANVRRRLELLYPNRHEINISQEKDVFTVNVKIEL